MAHLDWQSVFADRVSRMQASEIRELLKLLDQPDIISFAGGIPSPDLFPTEAIQAAYQELLGDPALAAQGLQYSMSEGYLPLRRWIVRHMAGLGVPCTVENVVITSGSQQGLDFLGKLLLSPHDTALVTAPTYLGALQAFNAYQPRYDTLRLDGGNRTPDSYREAAAAVGGRVKFAYLVPDFANPTRLTVDLEGRRRLLELARALDIVVIEDAAYASLRFAGDALPPVLALDVAHAGSIDQARTLYCGTFSKTLAPGLRVGWICGARRLIEKVVLTKQAQDLHSPTINQMVMHRVADAAFDQQVDRNRAAYGQKRTAMLDALARHMPGGTAWSEPQGGMFVWVTLPAQLDGVELLAAAVRQARVAFVPGSAFFTDGTGRDTLRLSYSLATPEQIEAGIARLGRLVAGKLAGARDAA